MIPTGGWFTLQWHITHRCNLRCTHCYQDDYAAFGSREALANVLGLLREARERGVTTAVLSNGTLIGRREAVRLQACGVDYVQISLDGMERTHDAIRGKGSFARAVAGIRALRERKIFVTVSFTAQRGNLGELPKLARFCDDIGVNKLWYDRVVIPAAEDKDHLSLTAEEFARLSRRAAKLNRKGQVSCARALQFLTPILSLCAARRCPVAAAAAAMPTFAEAARNVSLTLGQVALT